MTELNSSQPQAKYLSDYQPSDFLIPTVDLQFNLDDHQTLVLAQYRVERAVANVEFLKLDCQVAEVLAIKIDGAELSADKWQLRHGTLSIPMPENAVGEHVEVMIESRVDPANNKALEGLYKSAGVFCTQCEAEGFRKITPFLDRPDILSVYTVTIYADAALYPSMLSNGNLVDEGLIEEGDEPIRWVKWHDPHPKPCYLFALVAGDFDLLADTFTTQSGREVRLEIYVDKGNLSKATHAMSSLKKSMAWDEEKYGLEYDLDIYMIVAVDFFNMGAMENKGLNIFNSKYVLADERTATDTDYHGVEAVIAHEYFHNWTGNRVTCRDWFQLSLKEGLTVFRDQQFSADMGSEVLERIKHANVMRTHQFAEDSGPMAHPIRPQKVIEMNNFYTVTVYDKGAEVIRMLHSALGESGFRQGMDLYFERHDGQAVTCDDFVAAMADANQVDLGVFKHWYQQAGTPVVEVAMAQTPDELSVSLQQSIPSREPHETPLALYIPVKYELLEKATGNSIKRGTWTFTDKQQTFVESIPGPVELVLFENFSAPVDVQLPQSNEQLLFIATNATDPFCRWDAVQKLWANEIKSDLTQSDAIDEFVRAVVADDALDWAIKAELIAVPSFDAIAQQYEKINVEQILAGLEGIASHAAQTVKPQLIQSLQSLQGIPSGYDMANVAQRRYKSVVLNYLARIDGGDITEIITDAFRSAVNMTEKMAALEAARVHQPALLEQLLQQMNDEFGSETLVLDKMLSLVGRVNTDEVYDLIETWRKHPNFDSTNPNRIRALYGAFIMGNHKQYHDISGKGYQYLVDLLLKVDQFNPQVASRMIAPLLSFERFDDTRSALMKASLQQLSDNSISADLFEKVTAALS